MGVEVFTDAFSSLAQPAFSVDLPRPQRFAASERSARLAVFSLPDQGLDSRLAYSAHSSADDAVRRQFQLHRRRADKLHIDPYERMVRSRTKRNVRGSGPAFFSRFRRLFAAALSAVGTFLELVLAAGAVAAPGAAGVPVGREIFGNGTFAPAAAVAEFEVAAPYSAADCACATATPVTLSVTISSQRPQLFKNMGSPPSAFETMPEL